MALVNLPNADSKFQSGQPAYGTDVSGNINAIVNDYNGNITNVNIATNASIADTKLAAITTAGKVGGTSLTDLINIPAIAGVIPAANLPSLGAGTEDLIARGFELIWSSTTAIVVNPGTLYVGSTAVKKTATTTLTISTAGDYIGGVSQRGTSKWLYVYCNDAGALKLYATAPNKADTAGNSAGTLYYYLDGSTYYRCLGAIRLNATGSGEIVTFYQFGNFIQWGADISVITGTGAGQSCAAAMPAISTSAEFSASITAISNGAQVTLAGSGAANFYISTDESADHPASYTQQRCGTSATQTIGATYNGVTTGAVYVHGYYLNIR